MFASLTLPSPRGARVNDRGWVFYRAAPPPLYRRVPPGWRHDSHEHRWKGREWKHERIPHEPVKHHGRGGDRHWQQPHPRGAQGMDRDLPRRLGAHRAWNHGPHRRPEEGTVASNQVSQDLVPVDRRTARTVVPVPAMSIGADTVADSAGLSPDCYPSGSSWVRPSARLTLPVRQGGI
jgi:hypothetical protein